MKILLIPCFLLTNIIYADCSDYEYYISQAYSYADDAHRYAKYAY